MAIMVDILHRMFTVTEGQLTNVLYVYGLLELPNAITHLPLWIDNIAKQFFAYEADMSFPVFQTSVAVDIDPIQK